MAQLFLCSLGISLYSSSLKQFSHIQILSFLIHYSSEQGEKKLKVLLSKPEFTQLFDVSMVSGLFSLATNHLYEQTHLVSGKLKHLMLTLLRNLL